MNNNIGMKNSKNISITELKRNSRKVFDNLRKEGEIVVLMDNKPVAILKDIKNISLKTKEYFSFDFGKEGIDADLILNNLK